MATDQERFLELLAQFKSIAELSRISGLSRRAIEYKRDGERGVTRWDVLAIERALQIKHSKDS